MQKQEKIIEMFNQIAPIYDKSNRILSFGMDISWRKKACERVLNLYLKQDLHIIDVACGTGDMMKIWHKSALSLNRNIVSMKGVDPSKGMLEVAKRRFKNFEFIEACAQNLPLGNESADIISVSYGIRNIMQRKEALKEFSRVLKKDGILLILEFTRREKNGLVALFRDFYLKNMLPLLGGLISKNKKAYEYLPSSIEAFLSKEEFITELENIDFKMLEFRDFGLGVSSMFITQKI